MGPSYTPGRKTDLFLKPIQRVLVMMGQYAEAVDDVPCGNIVSLIGIDQYLLRSGTLSCSDQAYPIVPMKISTLPLINAVIEPKKPSDLPKFVEGLKLLAKSDPCVQTSCNDIGQYIVAATSELHLETCLHNLESKYIDIPIIKGKPYFSLRETVSETSSITCLAKAPNKHNRLYMFAEPLGENLTKAIENGEIFSSDGKISSSDSKISSSSDENKTLMKHLEGVYNWQPNEAKGIWAFGDEISNRGNVLVNTTKFVSHVDEIRDSCQASFQWATREGVLCCENVRGVKFNLTDCTLHPDAIHRSAGQIIPTCRRVMYASFLSAKPRLQEPVYLVDILCPYSVIGSVYSCLNKRNGLVLSQDERPGTPLCLVKCSLPVRESFGFINELRNQTSGQAIPRTIFDHWQTIDGDPLVKGNIAYDIVLATRERKGLLPNVKDLSYYLDKL